MYTEKKNNNGLKLSDFMAKNFLWFIVLVLCKISFDGFFIIFLIPISRQILRRCKHRR